MVLDPSAKCGRHVEQQSILPRCIEIALNTFELEPELRSRALYNSVRLSCPDFETMNSGFAEHPFEEPPEVAIGDNTL